MKLHKYPHYEKTCPQCGMVISSGMVQQGGLHVGCFEVKIDVWFVSLPFNPTCGYYEKDISQISAMLENAEDQYLIERQQMKAGLFYNLPEFQGF